MGKLLAFSVGDKSSGIITIPLPNGSNGKGPGALLNDPNILTHTLQTLITFLIVAGVLITFGFVLFEGFRYMTSQGDKEELEKSRSSILNSLVGLAIILTAFFVINLVGYLFNIHLLKTSLLSQ